VLGRQFDRSRHTLERDGQIFKLVCGERAAHERSQLFRSVERYTVPHQATHSGEGRTRKKIELLDFPPCGAQPSGASEGGVIGDYCPVQGADRGSQDVIRVHTVLEQRLNHPHLHRTPSTAAPEHESGQRWDRIGACTNLFPGAPGRARSRPATRGGEIGGLPSVDRHPDRRFAGR
jgi:hypothetical protein